MKRTQKMALSGIATAAATIFVAIGNVTPLIDYSMYMLASIVIMLVFVTKDIIWPVLVAVGAFLLGLIFAPNIMVMFPFFVFFAPYALLCGVLRLKSVKNIISYILKAIFFAVSIYLVYQFSTLFIEINTRNLPIYIILSVAFVSLFVYDFLMKKIIYTGEKMIIKLINRTSTK